MGSPYNSHKIKVGEGEGEIGSRGRERRGSSGRGREERERGWKRGEEWESERQGGLHVDTYKYTLDNEGFRGLIS